MALIAHESTPRKRPVHYSRTQADELTAEYAKRQDNAKAFDFSDRFASRRRSETTESKPFNPYASLIGPDRE